MKTNGYVIEHLRSVGSFWETVETIEGEESPKNFHKAMKKYNNLMAIKNNKKFYRLMYRELKEKIIAIGEQTMEGVKK